MEPLLIILVPGVFGGLVLALLIASNRWGAPSTVVPRPLAAPSYALINMAHIRIEGVGGLGMVAAVVAVAVADPRIRLAMIVAAVLGAGLALVLIAKRRRTGALPSNGDGPDDRSMLHLDAERRTNLRGVRGTIDHLERAGAMRCLHSAQPYLRTLSFVYRPSLNR
jgi:hypothetical protein